MIKIIHYCWFGNNPKTKKIEECIESWRKFFPDWEIIEWNESNFDINCSVYTKQAYEMKKWAFVSDYCRFWALEKYGGLYFDTDVEVIKSFDDLLKNNFCGFETEEFVNPGLVLYIKEPNNEIITKIKKYYDTHTFLNEKGERIRINVCNISTNILKEFDFKPNGEKQICGDLLIYPKDYFCPYDDATGLLHKTENTYSIHWYDKSWMTKDKLRRNKIIRIVHRVISVKTCEKIKSVLRIK